VSAQPQRGLLPLIMAITVIGPLSLNILLPALPGLAAEFHTSLGAVQLVLSLYLFCFASFQLLMGSLSDRFGRRPVAIAGFAILIVSCIGALFAAQIGELIAARIIQACGAATGIVLGRAIVRDVYDRERSAAMLAVVSSVTIFAPILAPLLGGALDTAFGWKSTFVFLGAFAVVVLVWIVASLPETRPAHTAKSANFLADTKLLIGNRRFLGYILTLTLGAAAFFTFLSGGPHVVVTLMHRSSAEYGFWIGSFAVGFLVGTLLVQRFVVRYGIDRMIDVGMVLIVGSVLAMTASVALFSAFGPVAVFAPAFTMAIGNACVFTNTVAGAVSVRPEVAGTAAGLAGFSQVCLGSVATQAVGYALSGAASALPMTLMMLVFIGAALIPYALLLKRAKS
jgi:DHA1 family bicyclomycin/chloramphenicol resistance-like MFS transporter